MKTLNELSARTLRSYVRKATDDKKKVGKAIDEHPPFHQVATTSGEKAAWKSHGELNQKLRKHINRVTGVKKAEKKLTLRVVEDVVPTNCAGSGAIKGIGTGPYPDSEPGVPKKRLKVILRNAKMLTRKLPNV